MSNPLSPYLPYILEYAPFLSFNGYNVECGDLENVLSEDAEDHHGCNICEFSTTHDRCLFNSYDPLYSIFQKHLRYHHPELFL